MTRMPENGDDIQFHVADDWTAVYLNGKLERVGDSYLADEWLQEYVGVKVVSDDAFLCGQSTREAVAQTVEAVDVYREWRDRKREDAQRLRDEAARLVAQAEELEEEAK